MTELVIWGLGLALSAWNQNKRQTARAFAERILLIYSLQGVRGEAEMLDELNEDTLYLSVDATEHDLTAEILESVDDFVPEVVADFERQQITKIMELLGSEDKTVSRCGARMLEATLGPDRLVQLLKDLEQFPIWGPEGGFGKGAPRDPLNTVNRAIALMMDRVIDLSMFSVMAPVSSPIIRPTRQVWGSPAGEGPLLAMKVKASEVFWKVDTGVVTVKLSGPVIQIHRGGGLLDEGMRGLTPGLLPVKLGTIVETHWLTIDLDS